MYSTRYSVILILGAILIVQIPTSESCLEFLLAPFLDPNRNRPVATTAPPQDALDDILALLEEIANILRQGVNRRPAP